MNKVISNKRAFTLIELLVVVLIIGILAAIAVPQYKKAVMKSRLTEAIVQLRAMQDNIDIYLLSHGFPQTGEGSIDINAYNSVDVEAHNSAAERESHTNWSYSEGCSDRGYCLAMISPLQGGFNLAVCKGAGAVNNTPCGDAHPTDTQWGKACIYENAEQETLCDSLVAQGWVPVQP